MSGYFESSGVNIDDISDETVLKRHHVLVCLVRLRIKPIVFFPIPFETKKFPFTDFKRAWVKMGLEDIEVFASNSNSRLQSYPKLRTAELPDGSIVTFPDPKSVSWSQMFVSMADLDPLKREMKKLRSSNARKSKPIKTKRNAPAVEAVGIAIKAARFFLNGRKTKPPISSLAVSLSKESNRSHWTKAGWDADRKLPEASYLEKMLGPHRRTIFRES